MGFEMTLSDANRTLIDLNGEVEEEIQMKLGKR
jgi:hypothetical protein